MPALRPLGTARAAWANQAKPYGEIEMLPKNGYNAVHPINLATQVL
jgi:hypothetical protein